ncbi:hypothetical protein [Sulfobacillus thermosulfidooxidans]|nr:hypothetical protein [Sulfobacillus thermosulfidooxidans]
MAPSAVLHVASKASNAIRIGLGTDIETAQYAGKLIANGLANLL